MSNVRRLRGTNFSVDLDYPRDIQEARSNVVPIQRDQTKQSKIQGKNDIPRKTYT